MIFSNASNAFLVVMVIVASFATSNAKLKIGSWKLDGYGQSDIDRAEDDTSGLDPSIKMIVDAALECDILCVQDIRDYLKKIPGTLLTAIKAIPAGTGYSMAESDRVGPSIHVKVQYVCYYNGAKVTKISEKSVAVAGIDYDPYWVTFKSVATGIKFTVISVIIQSGSVKTQLNDLETGLFPSDTCPQPGYENKIIIGDFKADCSHLSSTEKASTKFFTDPKYQSLLPDGFHTHIYPDGSPSSTVICTYERIFVNGHIGLQIAGTAGHLFAVAGDGSITPATKVQLLKVALEYPVMFEISEDKDYYNGKSLFHTSTTPDVAAFKADCNKPIPTDCGSSYVSHSTFSSGTFLMVEIAWVNKNKAAFRDQLVDLNTVHGGIFTDKVVDVLAGANDCWCSDYSSPTNFDYRLTITCIGNVCKINAEGMLT